MLNFNQQLLDFIYESPTPFHAVRNMLGQLEAAGFRLLAEDDEWVPEPGKYAVVRNDSSLIAFVLPAQNPVETGIHIAGAHTDSPCLRLKPRPEITRHGLMQLGAEVYGGALLNPWFDRDLSLAGRVVCRSASGERRNLLVDFRRPLAVIPSLAIHLDREVNSQRKINPQTDIVPVILRTDGESRSFDEILLHQVDSEHPQADVTEVLSHELFFYDTQPPSIVGIQDDFIVSARLDNLLSCFVGMKSLLDTVPEHACLLVCNDHEEVGSMSACGAHGPFLDSILERIAGNSTDRARMASRSMMISCDNAHALHPNYADKYDGNHGPEMNQGPVIKTNANQRYATNAETAAVFRQLCRIANVPVQDFVMRTDMMCGSTIGPITASVTGIDTVDVGVPQLAMHSVREMCGSRDPEYLHLVLREFYRRSA